MFKEYLYRVGSIMSQVMKCLRVSDMVCVCVCVYIYIYILYMCVRAVVNFVALESSPSRSPAPAVPI